MHRQLLRQDPEVIAVFAKNEDVWKQWQKENDFYDTNKIKWRYIRGRYSIMGIKFTMMFLVKDWYRAKESGKLTRLVHSIMFNSGYGVRTFSTEEAWSGGYRYRKEGL